MIFASTVFALSLVGRAVAQGQGQLETPRLTQAAQRAEFGVEGDTSAFKFKFSDSVRWCGCVVLSSTFAFIERLTAAPSTTVSHGGKRVRSVLKNIE
jgi:hypothetical protein